MGDGNKTVKSCEECGDLIAPKRVELLPEAKLCFDCQSDLERAGKHQRHKMNVEIRFKGDEVESYEQTVVRAKNNSGV